MFLGLIFLKYCFIVFCANVMFFSNPKGVIFAKNGVTRGRFAGLFAGVVKKKFDFFAAVLQDVELKRGEKVKKNFGVFGKK